MILYHARWLLPVSEPPIEYGTVAVDRRHIAYVGPRAGAPRGVAHDLGDVVLMPGLVDAYTRLELTLDGRASAVRSPFATPADLPPFDRLLDAARLGIAAGLRAGVTTFGDSGASGAGLQAMTEAGVRGTMYQQLVGPEPGAEQRARALASLRDAIDRLRPLETDLARLGVAPLSTYAVHEDLLVDACAYALGERLPIAIRVAESDDEIALLREARGPLADSLRARGIPVERRSHSPVHLLKELGVTDVARPLLVHGVKLDESDVAFIAASGCPVVHCPTSNASLGHGIAPLVELFDAGVTVGLGSDAVASVARMDVLDEARVASLLQSVRTGQPGAVSADRALEMATLGGARALGVDDRVGSLEVGKEADLAAFQLLPTRVLPLRDPVAATVFALGGVAASFVAVAGTVRVADGRLVDGDQGLWTRLERSAAAAD
ncbi:MAG TPA: amidohydrolase family protein [Gemmatimonadaceae bacterium]|nr:amidohydrolase family protein [Gemmatimonadaceae bacterium]